MTDKKTEKLLKKPDAFQTFFFHAFTWIKSQQKAVLVTVIPVLLVIIAGGAWQYYRYLNGNHRKLELSEIERAFAKEEKEPAKKQKLLRDEIRKLEEAAKKDAAKDPVKDVETKKLIEAKKMAMDDIVPDHKESLAKYLAFFHANEKTSEGWRAGMAAVEILSKAKNFEEASGILSKILASSMGIEFYQVQVRLMYVAVLEDLKKYDESLAEIEKILPLAPEDLLPRVLISKARVQMELGKKEEAGKTLDGIIASHAASPEARQAIAIKAL